MSSPLGSRTLPPPSPSRLPVLIVDDEPRLRDALARAVESWGFPVTVARSAEEAQRLFAEAAAPFDILILDLNLPTMSGIELFEKLRPDHPNLQVIILTGFGNLESARASIRLDVVDFLQKPCPLGDLEQSLYRAAQRLRKPLAPEESPAPVPVDSASAQTLEDLERQHILTALNRNNGNRTATALELGISRRTLQYKLSDYQRRGFAVD